MYSSKIDILKDFPELELTEFGDFKIKDEFVKDYEIIDIHCHLFSSVKSFIPRILRKEDMDLQASFFDLSCYPTTLKYFDFNKEMFTSYPDSLFSPDGIKTIIELSGIGGFISAIKKSTPERLLRDMKLNNISKSIVLQINTIKCDSSEEMSSIVSHHEEILTFGSIHPKDENIMPKIEKNISLGVKGWKINPHISGIDIDDKDSLKLLKELAQTNLPIISCSGIAFPTEKLNKGFIFDKQKKYLEAQNIKRFYNVLTEIPNSTFIFAHGGCYQTNELIELMKKYTDTYVDISVQPPSNIKKLIKEIGSERILFGTDYPAFNHAFPIVSVLRATDSVEERKNIFSRNAERLLKVVLQSES